MTTNRKQNIENSFDKKVHSYNRHASLQKKCAKKLCNFLPDRVPTKILEIGCGTGFLTENLQKKYPDAKILAIDISKNMIISCQQKFIGYQNLSFQVMDGEHIKLDQKFDLIISNLSIQWFENPVHGLKNMCKFLTPQGLMFYTTLGEDGFKEWTKTLKDLNLSSGIIGSPKYDGIFESDKKIITYKNALDFLRNFKKIGAHQPRSNYTPLTSAQLKNACNAHDIKHQGEITWHILYGCLDTSAQAARFSTNNASASNPANNPS